MIKTVLFDLDGTLLPMDNDEFIKTYFGLICKKFAPRGYDPDGLVKAIWAGTREMIKNDGSVPNEAVFRKKFSEIYGQKAYDDIPLFDEFYRNEFAGAKSVCSKNDDLVTLVRDLKTAGYVVALATNPVFPAIATENRMRWAGFEPSDFALCTTYENMGYCKPNPAYYTEIASRLGAEPSECIMIGNDVAEDGAAALAGMEVYILTDHIINRDSRPLDGIPHGGCEGIRERLLKRREKINE